MATKLGRPLRLLLGKPGLDGHSNGAEQIAARARDCGMEITYDGIRLTPQEIVTAAAVNPTNTIQALALRAALLGTGPGVVAASLATAMAFLACTVAPFPGLRDLGLTAGLGLLACLAAA